LDVGELSDDVHGGGSVGSIVETDVKLNVDISISGGTSTQALWVIVYLEFKGIVLLTQIISAEWCVLFNQFDFGNCPAGSIICGFSVSIFDNGGPFVVLDKSAVFSAQSEFVEVLV